MKSEKIVFWSVDSLIIKDNVVFGFGWIFHAKYEIESVRFKLSFINSTKFPPLYILADAGKSREDVRGSFKDQSHAIKPGYVVYGAYPEGADIDSIELVCSIADGSAIELSVPKTFINQHGSSNKFNQSLAVFRQFYYLFKRGLHLAHSRNFTSLAEKVVRYLRGQPKSVLFNPEGLSTLLQGKERENICLIVDHDLGGGANHYRERLVDSMIKDGRSVIIVTYHVATLSHVLILKNSRVNRRFSIPDVDFVLKVIIKLSVTDVIYNTAVSFAKPEEIPCLLINLKKRTSARLQVLVHDFFLVCPSHFLIDHEGKHCHLPEVSVCSNCLPENQQGFATLFIEHDIQKWRAIWGSMLLNADEIVTFSNNSAVLFLKAYPQIEKSRILVVPHTVNHLSGQLPKILNTDSLRIGVVGQIGFHKGSLFIQSLAREIGRRSSDVKIIVIGTIEATCDPQVVTQTGPYHHAELKGLIEKSGVNIFLFPSIWPETFSYVVQELMSMSLPIASFNFGAPAERLTSYPKGQVLNSMDPGRVLDALVLFHRKIYLGN